MRRKATPLRREAKGRECRIRVPGFCTFDREQTVLCHVRMVEIPTKNFPGRDLLGAWGCAACHRIVDGQQRTRYTKDERDLMLLQGVMRTQAALLSEGKIGETPEWACE